MAKKTSGDAFDRIPFRMHPRVFAALGADLVTNDVVAVIELVKNSYDAFASNVWLRFSHDDAEGRFLEIEDDGHGMTREIIEDVWCLVATPYKSRNPKATSGKKMRRVVGEKGLGRLSASRLGKRLNMLTQASGCPCWELKVNWSEISNGDDLSACLRGAGSTKGSRHSAPQVRAFAFTILRPGGMKVPSRICRIICRAFFHRFRKSAISTFRWWERVTIRLKE